ncbi:hypothetical protein Forpe1208_v016316 [Fusarium oxysporum f. sp. rapae]|uniref:Uncharacterized protein n=1 Tax=Fusarium oxysporum f. sp. rapae TaxID=485398 RepID=A0A8J5NHN9_FUSOX|nr:hypothetical protein Forpe1208_v016316 [Fusarium oxysporum f. sp. rapae]
MRFGGYIHVGDLLDRDRITNASSSTLISIVLDATEPSARHRSSLNSRIPALDALPFPRDIHLITLALLSTRRLFESACLETNEQLSRHPFREAPVWFEWDLDVLYRWPDKAVHIVDRVVERVEEFGGDIGAEDVCVHLVGGVCY